MAPKRSRAQFESDYDAENSDPPSPPKKSSLALAHRSLQQRLQSEQSDSTANRSSISSASGRSIKIKEEDTSAEENSQAAQSPSQITYEHVKKVLAGPAGRGRKIGSGRGETRKDAAAYSTNHHAKKSKARRQAMNPLEVQIHNTRNRDDVWVSRKITEFKKKPEYTSLPQADQAAAIAQRKKELRFERLLTSDNDENRIMMRIMDKFREQLSADLNSWKDKIVTELRERGVPDNSDEYFFSDSEDEESGDNAEAQTSLHDCLVEIMADFSRGQAGIRNMKDSAERRKRTLPTIVAWSTLRIRYFKQLVAFVVAMKHLRWLGRIEVDGMVQPRWLKFVGRDHDITAADVFNRASLQKFLRASWSLQSGNWVDLPGPASLWPDDGLWYVENGLDFGEATQEECLQAIEKVDSAEPPKNWIMSLCGFAGHGKDIMWRLD